MDKLIEVLNEASKNHVPSTEKSRFKKVSKEEFADFIKNYPAPLDYDVTGISDPPMGSHNDFSTGKVWPESMVTKIILYDGSDYYDGQTTEYYILDNNGEEGMLQ